MTTIETQ